jgi:hypothetical protein
MEAVSPLLCCANITSAPQIDGILQKEEPDCIEDMTKQRGHHVGFGEIGPGKRAHMIKPRLTKSKSYAWVSSEILKVTGSNSRYYKFEKDLSANTRNQFSGSPRTPVRSANRLPLKRSPAISLEAVVM